MIKKIIIPLYLMVFGCTTFSLDKIDIPNKLKSDLKSFEPSGAIYLLDLNQYLIASDDTDKKNSAFLFLMDTNGKIDESPIMIKGVTKMTDIESLYQDEQGHLIILSSMSLNKNNKNLVERNLLVRARRNGKEITAMNQIELRPLLLKALKDSQIPELKSIKNNFDQELDVESSFVKDGELYIGLKGPQLASGVALILNLGSTTDLFSQQKINLRLWKIINFSKLSGEQDFLSEIALDGESLILSTTNSNEIGRIWKFEPHSNKLFLIQEFAGLHPEGLAVRTHPKTVLITFDQHGEYPMFTHLNL